jgi:GDP-L-fucose synthase
MEKKILVTGGTGMVGKYLQNILPEAIYIGSKDCDLTDINRVERLWSKIKPDVVVHLGAKVGGILENLESPADFYNINTLINTNVLMTSKKYNVKRFTGILSTCMYPDVVETYPMTETDIHLGAPSYANFSYGFTKRSLSVGIDAYNKQYKTKYNYLIPCNLYGEYDHFNDPNKCHFITALIRKIIDAEINGDNNITLLGTGSPLRQFMHAGDLARTIKIVIENDITDSFNVATPEENTIEDMANITLNALNKNIGVVFDTSKPDGQIRKTVSCDKMLSLIGDFEFTKLKDGVINVYNEVIKRYEK